MKKITKFMIISASVLLFAGIFIFALGMTRIGWDFTKLSTEKYETNTYEIRGDVTHIIIKATAADILFVPSNTDKCMVSCHETITERHSISMENGVLAIEAVNTKKWYDYIGITAFDSPKITLYLPKDYYTLVKINLSTGDISLSNLKIHSLSLSTKTGDTTLSNITCNGLASIGSTGNITLNNVVANTIFSIQRSTGDITLNACDGDDISLNTTTGDIKGTILSEKNFRAKATTGSVSVPDTNTGGNCTIHATTGDIKIKIAE